MKSKNSFPMKEKDIIYFDNAATTFKPYRVINKIVDYYTNYTSNSHRGDYDISFRVDDEIDKTREKVKSFINARSKEEIIFTNNTTDSLNRILFETLHEFKTSSLSSATESSTPSIFLKFSRFTASQPDFPNPSTTNFPVFLCFMNENPP